MTTPVLVLDAGHGLTTAGKQTMSGKYGIIKEWELNNKVVGYMTEYLSDYDITIYRTDDPTGKTDIDLLERVKRCNSYAPILFISIHHNAGNGTGIEVYWHTKGTAEDKKVAGIVAPKLSEQTGLKNRGVKTAEFTVLTCQATAILVEGGFMDTQSDYEYICSEAGQRAYAKAVADSVIEYLGSKKTSYSSGSSSSSASSTTSTSNDYKVGTYEKNVKVTADDGLNVRSERNASSSIITTLAKGSVIEVGYIMYENNQTTGTSLWGGVVVNGKQGYINLTYTEPCGDTTTSTNSSDSSFLVKIICDELNIRKEASFDSAIVGTVKNGEVFTIVDEDNGLYKLKSGAGWISSNPKYTQKI